MFEILMCCYGDYYDISSKSINSIIDNSTLNIPKHIGLNTCGNETKKLFRDLLDNNSVTTLIESNINMNKDPMMFKLMDCVESEYFVWFDDDSYVTTKGWDQLLVDHIKKHHPFDVSGFPHVSNRFAYGSYQSFLKSRRWYRGKTYENDIAKCVFPHGALWVARAAYLAENCFPDCQMVKKCDDMLMGDLLHQTNGKFVTLFGWDDVFKVNTAKRRGTGETDKDGFKI